MSNTDFSHDDGSDMETLCDMMKKQSVTCTETNTDNIYKDWHQTAYYLKVLTETPLSSCELGQVSFHLETCVNRYKDYLRQIRLRGQYEYLALHMEAFIRDVGQYTAIAALLQTYYIDTQFFVSIGCCPIVDSRP